MSKNTKSSRKLEGSLKRKYDYNRKMKDNFGVGYTAGVELYNMYPNETKEGQKNKGRNKCNLGLCERESNL